MKLVIQLIRQAKICLCRSPGSWTKIDCLLSEDTLLIILLTLNQFLPCAFPFRLRMHKAVKHLFKGLLIPLLGHLCIL